MKRIGATVAAGLLIALFSCPGSPRAQPKDKPDKVTLAALASQVAALQSTVSSLQSTVTSQQSTVSSLQSTVSSLQTQLSSESPINALAANFFMFDGFETETHLNPSSGAQGGIPFYDNSVTVPPGTNTLYVTIGGTADLDMTTNAFFIGCRVDGAPCTFNSQTAANQSPSGWVMMEDLSAGAQPVPTSDNGFYYTWCTHIFETPDNSHAVELRLASQSSHNVFIEQYHVFVNGAAIKDPGQACNGAGGPV